MKKKGYKRRCEKISLSKCDGGICRAFNPKNDDAFDGICKNLVEAFPRGTYLLSRIRKPSFAIMLLLRHSLPVSVSLPESPAS